MAFGQNWTGFGYGAQGARASLGGDCVPLGAGL